MADQFVRIIRKPPVVEIVLDRADKRNALNARMIAQIREAFVSAAGDNEVHVVVLSAAGPDFCAGFDLTTVDSDEGPQARAERERAELFEFSLGIRNHPSPTIALVQGANVAAGLLISQACDLVVASEDAYFYNPLVRMGGVGLEVLWEPYDLGFRQAKRILFTGGRLSAPEARQLGMVTDVVPREELAAAGRQLAARIAAMPPETLRLLKRSLNAAQDAAGMRAGQEQHFELHQQGHRTSESRRLLHDKRLGRDLKDYFAERDAGRPGG
jgi:enoyl-CoA hydratase